MMKTENKINGGDESLKINVFEFLEFGRNEAILHTRMIASMLRPGNPACDEKSLFLRLFFKMLERCHADSGVAEAWADDSWCVEREKRIEGISGGSSKGSIDILISSRNRKTAIVVENKIDASESTGQLAKYAQPLEKDFKKVILFLLTPQGVESVSSGGRKCSPLSYGNMLEWLDDCMKFVGHEKFLGTISDYREIVCGLIPHKLSTADEGPKKIGRKNATPDEYSRLSLNFLGDLKGHLEKEFGEKFLVVLKPCIAFNNYHKIVLIHREFKAHVNTHRLLWLTLEVGLGNRAHTGFYCGFHWMPEFSGSGSCRPQFRAWLEKLQRINHPAMKGALEARLPFTNKETGWLIEKEKIDKIAGDADLVAWISRGVGNSAIRVIPKVQNMIVRHESVWKQVNNELLKQPELGKNSGLNFFSKNEISDF